MTPKRATFDYAAQWNDLPDSEELTLPSGFKVRLRAPNLPQMARRGLIPNHLLPVIEKFVFGGMRELIKEVPALQGEGVEPGARLMHTADLDAYIETMCVASIVDPVFSFDGKAPGTIDIAKLAQDDRFAVWDWGVGLSKALQSFRGLTDGPVQPLGELPDGAGVRDATEPDARTDAAD